MSTFPSRWLRIFVMLLLFLQIMGHPLDKRQQQQQQPPPVLTGNNSPLPVPIGIGGVVLICVGIYLCFFGYRFFKLTMFMIGLYTVSNLAAIGLLNSPAAGNPSLILAVSLIVGAIAGLILCCCWHFGVYVLGGLAGYTVAMYLLAFKANGLIESSTGRGIFIAVFVLAGILLVIFLERPVVATATAFLGAFAFFLGVDFFARTGFADAVHSFLTGGKFEFSGGRVYGILVGVAIMFLIGLGVQLKWHMPKFDGFSNRATPPYGWEKRRAHKPL
ncbi:uncharacterized protein VTP21DRAFT_11551 [Calcarisporiella thermophila]|uniref:uncharacterized protein n=1 Tax=Calcarisporiella thermophila TaxID=911321 RepID=UPI003743B09A